MVWRTFLTASIAVALLVHVLTPAAAYAGDPLVSPSFQMTEHSLGNSSLFNSSSDEYRVNLSVGDTAVQSSAADDSQIDSGSITTDDPALTFIVDDFDADFGNFSASSTSVASSTFTVSNYTSYGYTVYVVGDPPSNDGYELEPMEETGSSVTGESQFGINLVANTDPESFGENPDQGDFGFGEAAEDYDISNQFRYNSGESIASSAQSGGVTDYTISYIANIEGLAPGGQYSSNLTLIAVGTF